MKRVLVYVVYAVCGVFLFVGGFFLGKSRSRGDSDLLMSAAVCPVEDKVDNAVVEMRHRLAEKDKTLEVLKLKVSELERQIALCGDKGAQDIHQQSRRCESVAGEVVKQDASEKICKLPKVFGFDASQGISSDLSKEDGMGWVRKRYAPIIDKLNLSSEQDAVIQDAMWNVLHLYAVSCDLFKSRDVPQDELRAKLLEVDAKTREQISRMKETLDEEQFKSLNAYHKELPIRDFCGEIESSLAQQGVPLTDIQSKELAGRLCGASGQLNEDALIPGNTVVANTKGSFLEKIKDGIDVTISTLDVVTKQASQVLSPEQSKALDNYLGDFFLKKENTANGCAGGGVPVY
jgi:hypothetical protein